MATKKTTPAKNKTVETAASVGAFLDTVADPVVRADCDALVAMLERVTGEKAAMWGTAIVGFGSYHYVYESGREGDMCLIGFSPRKQNLTIYVVPGFEFYADQLARLGKHKLGKSCLYLSGLKGLDLGALEEMLADSVARMRAR